MSNYGNQFGENPMGRSRDVVLSINEFCFLQNKKTEKLNSLSLIFKGEVLFP